MLKTVRLLALLGVLALPAAVVAMPDGRGKPPPIPCPADVAVAIAETCPCAGKMLPDSSVEPWKNHGKYVSCVVRFRNQLRKSGCLTDDQKRTIARCAARSTCGKETKVLCCFYETGTCNDPMPGDLTPAGVCSNDAALACDTDADCTKSHSRIARDDAACVADGGVNVGAGSVCQACPPPPPPAP